MQAAIHNHQSWITETDPQALRRLMEGLLEAAGFCVLNRVEHRFEPQGYTAMWLLAESHLAVHTFPEAGQTYVELSSCNGEKNARFVALLRRRAPLSEERKKV